MGSRASHLAPQILYGVGFSEEDLKATVPVIFSNVISSMQALVKATSDFSLAVAARVSENNPPSLAMSRRFAEPLSVAPLPLPRVSPARCAGVYLTAG